MPHHLPPTTIEGLAAVVGTHADRLEDQGHEIGKLDHRQDQTDLQLAVWKAQLRLLAAIAGLVGGVLGGGVGGLVSVLAG